MLKVVNFALRQSMRYKQTVSFEKVPNLPQGISKDQLTNFIESKDEFKFVERLLPSSVVPEPPHHDMYPTPSGWFPPDFNRAKQWPYSVSRTRFHNFPIYETKRYDGPSSLVRIRYIEGDIQQFDEDLRKFIEKEVYAETKEKIKVTTSINEVQRQLLVKGKYITQISKFLAEKGF